MYACEFSQECTCEWSCMWVHVGECPFVCVCVVEVWPDIRINSSYHSDYIHSVSFLSKQLTFRTWSYLGLLTRARTLLEQCCFRTEKLQHWSSCRGAAWSRENDKNLFHWLVHQSQAYRCLQQLKFDLHFWVSHVARFGYNFHIALCYSHLVMVLPCVGRTF